MARLPSLETLRIFAVAARHLSFTIAAGELNLTQSAISHRVRALEEELGVPLFDRLTRRLELTRAGQVLAQRVDQAVGDIARDALDRHRALQRACSEIAQDGLGALAQAVTRESFVLAYNELFQLIAAIAVALLLFMGWIGWKTARARKMS